jgi:hypothetical protein
VTRENILRESFKLYSKYSPADAPTHSIFLL